MTLADAFVAELEMESATTRCVLDRVPEAHLDWRPHHKSSTLGQLALHVAELPQQLTAFVSGERLDFTAVDTRQAMPTTKGEIMTAFDRSLAGARSYLAALDDTRAAGTWTLCAGEVELFTAPRAAVIRSFLFNHRYHHRGQLLVYLRLLDVPVPAVFGPSADENPFAAALGARSS
jgi:uncharacterized damage-inducible protein DinB